MAESTRRGSRYPEQTGAIWEKPERSRSPIVRRVCSRLEREYGRPRLDNPVDPLDDLIFIILSNRTSAESAVRTYQLLKQEFPTWEHVLQYPLLRLQKLLEPIGLSQKRSSHIRSSLLRIKGDFGSCDLTPLGEKTEAEIHTYLVSLPGVSDKIAKCVMLYTLGKQVLPVDAHVHRVSRRLGWIDRKRADQCHQELEALVPRHLRYTFHVTCIAHGRSVCHSTNPRCAACVIRRDCNFSKSQLSVKDD